MSETAQLILLRESIVKLDFGGAEKAIGDAMKKGISPTHVIENVRSALDIVGEKFEKQEYFLSELVVAGEIAKEAMNTVQPFIRKQTEASEGKVVLATVFGDIHNIGKNIVSILLAASGFEVFDLGVNVPTQKIVEAVRENKPDILGLSALLTVTMAEMGTVIRELQKAGLREDVRIIVGGSPVTEEFAEMIGADHRAADAVEGVQRCLQWMTQGR